MGGYGTVSDPQKSLDGFFETVQRESAGDEDAELVGTAETQTPEGLDGAVMKCQNMKYKDPEPGMPETVPMCAWADHSTVAAVIDVHALSARPWRTPPRPRPTSGARSGSPADPPHRTLHPASSEARGDPNR
ncbi:hypothetical protein NKH77_18350 [Streptomyces sp. M19]